jgi:hypothetical protein
MKSTQRDEGMRTTNETQAQSNQFTGKAIEVLTLWADANQKILRELADLSTTAVEEGIQLHGKLQSSTLDALKEARGYWLSRQSLSREWQKEPFGSYQRNLLEGMQEAQKGFKIFERNALALTQTTERLQATAEKASREIQQTCSRFVADMKELYAPVQN